MRKIWTLFEQAVALACVAGIRLYQMTLSPLKHALMGPGAGCRFQPTCSAYALGCFRTLSLSNAIYHASRRICRCHPWGGSGYDPVPERDFDPKAGSVYPNECDQGSLKDMLGK